MFVSVCMHAYVCTYFMYARYIMLACTCICVYACTPMRIAINNNIEGILATNSAALLMRKARCFTMHQMHIVPTDAKLLGGNGLIQKNTKLESLDIPLDYEIGLDITPNDKIGTRYGSIVHFTATGTNCCEYGSRIPGLWFYPNTRKLHVVAGHSMNGNSNDAQWKCDTKLLTLEANKKYRLKIVFTRNTVSVWVNNKAACTDVLRDDHKVFKNVQVYVGDPWADPAQATVENLYFKDDTTSSKEKRGGGEFLFSLIVFSCMYAATLWM